MKNRSWILPAATLALLAVAIWRIEAVNENLETDRASRPVLAGQRITIGGVTTERWMIGDELEPREAWLERAQVNTGGADAR